MRCHWPSGCGEVPTVKIGMVEYCDGHAVEVQSTRARLVAELRRSTVAQRLRHERWAKERAAAPKQAEKKRESTVSQFWVGLLRHDLWRDERPSSPEQEVL